MNFAETLKKRAEETGQKVIKPKEIKTGAKSKSINDLSKVLGERSKAKKEVIQTNAQKDDALLTAPLGKVPSWSFSTLKNHEKCNYFTSLNKIDGQKQDQHPNAARGNEVHDLLEAFVKGEIAIDDLKFDKKTKFPFFLEKLTKYREMYANTDQVEVEEKWGIRKDWSPCTWDDDEIWAKGALDLFIRESETSCIIIDHKTGAKFMNEMKHADQCLCYALMAFHRYPELEFFKAEIWYIDHAETLEKTFTRKQLEVLLPRYHKRGLLLTTMTDFKPSSNVESCKWCSYGCNTNKDGRSYGTGVCEFDFYRGM